MKIKCDYCLNKVEAYNVRPYGDEPNRNICSTCGATKEHKPMIERNLRAFMRANDAVANLTGQIPLITEYGLDLIDPDTLSDK